MSPAGDGAPCPACGQGGTLVAEEASSDVLAARWRAVTPDAAAVLAAYRAEGLLPGTVVMRRCARCRLEFADPPAVADARWYAAVEFYSDRWEHARCVARLGSARRRVVDIGCGEGHFLRRAAAAGHDVVGLDFNQDALEIARASGLDVHAWDVRDAQQRTDRRFDAVAAFQVLEHAEDPVALLRDLASLLAPGGSVHLSCPSPRRYATRFHPDELVVLREMWDYPPHHQTRWNEQALAETARRAGLALEHYEEEPFRWVEVSRQLAAREERRGGKPTPSRVRHRARVAAQLARTAVAARAASGWSFYATLGSATPPRDPAPGPDRGRTS